MDYSTSAMNLIRNVRNNFQEGTQHANILLDYKLISAFRRDKNLKDLLVTAKVPSLVHTKLKIKDDIIGRNKWIYNHHSNKIFRAQSNTDKNTRNCVYLLQCNKCCKQYVGETGNTITIRLYQYKYNIRQKQNLTVPVIKHFVKHGWPSLRVIIIESNPQWTAEQRKKSERQWIRDLGTLQPRGLNEKGRK